MKMYRTIIITILLTPFVLTGLALEAFAQPFISGTSGTFSKNALVTVSGSNFGNHPDYDTSDPNKLCYAWHNFEAGALNGDGFVASCGGSCTDYWQVMTTGNRINSSYWARRIAPNGTSNMYGLQKPSSGTVSSPGKYFISFWFKTPSTTLSGKFARFAGDTLEAGADFWVATGSPSEIRASDDKTVQWGSVNSFDPEVWNRFDLLVDAAGNVQKSWIIGKNNNDPQWTLNWPVGGLDNKFQANLGAGKDGPASTDTNYYGYDDIFIDFTQARVEVCNSSTWAARNNCEIQIPVSWTTSSITVKVNPGSLTSTGNAYLYVLDENGSVNSQGYPIVIGAGPSADSLPSVAITSPSSGGTYTSSQNTVTISGSAGDDKGLMTVGWSNNTGGGGTATNVSGTWTSWSVANIPLQEGPNIITVTATDSGNQKTTSTITVAYSSTPSSPSTTPVLIWSANQQMGDSTWTNSSVTYCVRLLVQGSNITDSANTIQLGFQGRSSGSYTVKKVSIAQRDTNSSVGNVVDSTWTMVTFDGRSSSTWATDIVTVGQGTEKKSDPIPFSVLPGKDYYITCKIDTPSVYLNPPSGYTELYFDSDDHTSDVDWADKGFRTTQDYHAVATIYAVPQNGTLTPPTGLTVK